MYSQVINFSHRKFMEYYVSTVVFAIFREDSREYFLKPAYSISSCNFSKREIIIKKKVHGEEQGKHPVHALKAEVNTPLPSYAFWCS